VHCPCVIQEVLVILYNPGCPFVNVKSCIALEMARTLKSARAVSLYRCEVARFFSTIQQTKEKAGLSRTRRTGRMMQENEERHTGNKEDRWDNIQDHQKGQSWPFQTAAFASFR
jgi:hypothetical protein